MSYNISFAGGVEEAFETLDAEAASKVEKKLERVANDEWRTPYDWGTVRGRVRPATSSTGARTVSLRTSTRTPIRLSSTRLGTARTSTGRGV